MKKLLLSGAAVLLIAAAPASVIQAPAAQSISATDKAEGAKAHAQILEEYGGSYGGAQADYAAKVGRKVAFQSGIANVDKDFTITVLNSPVDNAFAIPGGYVYCTRQLLALMNDEAELAFVLGHESGHIAAHHAEKRQKAASRNSILGALGQMLVGQVAGGGALGQLLQKGIGTGSQLLTLSFSRKEEFEADDLGMLFSNKAGYDPRAAADMLGALGAQVTLDQQLAGSSRSTPAWASTHPDPGSRVQRALGRAQQLASSNTFRNNDAFLMSLKGLMYGDDPAQGVIEGQDFRYPVARFQFTAPTGYGMSNGLRAVTIAGSRGQATFSGGKYTGSLGDYIDTVFKGLSSSGSVSHSALQSTTINGMNAAYASSAAQSSDGQTLDVTVIAYAFAPGQAYHFVVLTPQGQGLGDLSALVQSFRRMTPAEAAAVRGRKIDIVTVKRGDTIDGIAKRMAYADHQVERFMVLNALTAGAPLVPGRKVKVVIYS